MLTKLPILLAFVSFVSSAAVDGGDHVPLSRVHGESKLSEQRHINIDGEHNAAYDHEAFLGDDAKEFDQLTPEESKARLMTIVNRIDKDEDGFVTQEELKDWIKYTQARYIKKDVDRQWEQHNPNKSEHLDWKTYRDLIYGFLDDNHAREDDDDTITSYRKMESRDQRRWNVADQDNNGLVTIEEFKNFVHPEEASFMRDIVVAETIEDIDKDNDGKITLEEYLSDIYRGEEGEPEPDWVKSEREQFKQHRDANNDGHMDTEEVKAWIIPSDFDNAEAESRHLIYESDADKDEKLTKDEIMNKYDLFVGSQATDFGEALSRHDEF